VLVGARLDVDADADRIRDRRVADAERYPKPAPDR